FSRSRADEHRREFVNVTVPDVGHVKLAGRVLAKRRKIYERDIAARRRNRKKLTGNILKVRSGRSVIIESKYSRASAARSEIITENVNALERGKHRAAINVTADDRASDAVRIIKNGIDPWRIRRRGWHRRRRWISRILNESFPVSPTVIFAPAGIGRLLNVNFFAGVLADVADKQPAGRAIETVPEGIAQTEQPNFALRRGRWRRSRTRVGIVSRNCVSPGRRIDVDAQHFGEQRGGVLRVAAGLDVAGAKIIRVSAIPG